MVHRKKHVESPEVGRVTVKNHPVLGHEYAKGREFSFEGEWPIVVDRTAFSRVERHLEVVVEVVVNDENHGKSQSIRSLNAWILPIGARDMAANDVSRAAR